MTPPRKSYETTNVPVSKSQDELRGLLLKFGAQQFSFGEGRDWAGVEFIHADHMVRVKCPLKSPSDEAIHARQRTQMEPSVGDRSWGQQGPSVSSLYLQAQRENPDDEDARRARYRQLMRNAGYLVDRCAFVENGHRCELPVHEGDGHSFDPPTLPCGRPL